MSTEYAKSKQGARRRQFKTNIDSSDARRKREENATKLRKEKRIESFAKRRNVVDSDNDVDVHTPLSERLKEIVPLAEDVKSNDIRRQYEATAKFRKLLSIEHNPPIQDVLDVGVLDYFVRFLAMNEQPQLQFEAAWALTNIASGTPEQTCLVVESGAIPLFNQLVKSPSEDVREQAIWALGNIAGDSPACRDYVLSFGVLDTIIRAMDSPKLTIVRNATWALSNLCRGKPQPAWEIISPALPVLCKLVYATDEQILTDAAWALSYLSDGANERIQAVLETGICKKLVELLAYPSIAVQTPALRTVGNIVTGDDSQTQHALNCNLVPNLLPLLSSTKKALRKEACWTVSNITAGSRAQIQYVLDANVFPKLVSLLKQSGDFDVKKEATWALSNATSGGSASQIAHLVDVGLIEPLCDVFSATDVRMVLVAMEALDNILKSGEKSAKEKTGVNPYISRVEACMGLDKIEGLQNHPNSDVYNKAVGLLEEFFGAEEDQNVAPNQTANTFQFAFNGTAAFAF